MAKNTTDRPWPSRTLLVLQIKRWHKAKTGCHMINEPWTPKALTDYEPPIKWLPGGLMRGAPQPLYPPYGGANILLGWVRGYYWWTIWPIRQSKCGTLLTPNITKTIIEKCPYHTGSLIPLDPYRGYGGVPMRGLIIIVLQPKCDIFGKAQDYHLVHILWLLWTC